MALKLRQRRWLRAEKRHTLTPPAFEIDARIDEDIHQVRQDADDQSDQAKGKQRAEDHRIVAFHRRFEAKLAPDRPAKRSSRSAGWTRRKTERNRPGKPAITISMALRKDMAIQHPTLGQALGAGGHDVVFA